MGFRLIVFVRGPLGRERLVTLGQGRELVALTDCGAALHAVDQRRNLRGVKRHVKKRLPLSAVFTRQLAPMPLNFANPVWVRADSVDLDRHIFRIRLPRPGTQRQLEAATTFAAQSRSLRDRSGSVSSTSENLSRRIWQ